MPVENTKALVEEAASNIRIEFTPDEQIMGLIESNTRTSKLARSNNNIYKCLAMIAGGTPMKTACRLTGIPRGTLQSWRSKEWYSRAIELIRDQLDQQLDGKMTHMINKGLDRLNDRLEGGDPHMLRDGSVAFKPVSAKDAAIITSIFFDKRNLLRNKPTAIVSKQSTDERLTDLANRFKEIAIEAEYYEVSDTEGEDSYEQGELAQTDEDFSANDGRQLGKDIWQIQQGGADEQAESEEKDSSAWSFTDS